MRPSRRLGQGPRASGARKPPQLRRRRSIARLRHSVPSAVEDHLRLRAAATSPPDTDIDPTDFCRIMETPYHCISAVSAPGSPQRAPPKPPAARPQAGPELRLPQATTAWYVASRRFLSLSTSLLIVLALPLLYLAELGYLVAVGGSAWDALMIIASALASPTLLLLGFAIAKARRVRIQ